MKKKIALLLTSCMVLGSLIGCGEATEEVPVVEDSIVEETVVENEEERKIVHVEYTEEQLAFIQEHTDLVEVYNRVIDEFNASELVNVQDLTDTLNSITEEIDEAGEIFKDPEKLTEETMDGYRIAFDNIYILLESIEVLLNEDFSEVSDVVTTEDISETVETEEVIEGEEVSKEVEETTEEVEEDYQYFTMMYDGDKNVDYIKCKWESDEEWIELLEAPLEAGNGIYTVLETKEETLLIKFIFDDGTEVDDSLTWEQIQEVSEYYDGDCVVNFSTGGIWDV